MPEKTVEVISKVNPETYEPLLGDCTLHVGESAKIEFRRGRAMAPVSVAQLLVDRRSDIDIPALGYTGGTATAARAATPAGTLETQAEHEHVGPPAGMDESDLQAAAGAIKQADPADLRALIALGKRAEEEVEERRREDAQAAGTRHAPTKEAGRAAAGPLADPDGTVRSEPAPVEEPPARTGEQVEPEPEAEPTGGPEQEVEELVSPEVAAAMEHLAGEELEEARVAPVAPEVAKAEEEPAPAADTTEPEPTADSPQPIRVIPPGFEAQTAEGEPRCLALTAANNQCHNAAVDDGPACKLERHQEQFAAEKTAGPETA